MKINNSTKLEISDYDSIVILCNENNELSFENDETRKALDYALTRVNEKENKKITKYINIPFITNEKSSTYIFAFYDKENLETSFDIQNFFGSLVEHIKKEKPNKVALCLGELENDLYIGSLVQGLILGDYTYEKYQTKAVERIIDIDLVSKKELQIEEFIQIAKSVCLSRNLVNEQANQKTPKMLAKKVVDVFENTDVKVTLFNKKEIEDMNMTAYLTVARGSSNEPVLIVMEYNGNPDSDELLGLVGKGLTFDTGGYSLKPTAGMLTMKSDMGGASAVIGAMRSLTKTNAKANVTAVVAACDNMLSADAYLPGDIVTSKSGKTIEIMNTDAEGRLTLADAMTVIINNYKVDKVIDIATLTGAAVAAFGEVIAPYIATDESLANAINNGAEICGEKVWRMPIDPQVKKMNKSEIADIKNTGGKFCGMMTAGLFVGEFNEGIPWLHLDIAGTAFTTSKLPTCPKGGTGFGARLLYYGILELNK